MIAQRETEERYMDLLHSDKCTLTFENFKVCANNIDDLIDYLQAKAHKLWEEEFKKVSVISSGVLIEEIISILQKSVKQEKI